nr:hypothetical protein [uncultured Novosphingobium sp.]
MDDVSGYNNQVGAGLIGAIDDLAGPSHRMKAAEVQIGELNDNLRAVKEDREC